MEAILACHSALSPETMEVHRITGLGVRQLRVNYDVFAQLQAPS